MTWTWAPYGDIAFGVHSPDGQLVAIVGYPHEKRLQYVRGDGARRNPEVAATEHRELLEGRDAHQAYAERIADALNAQEPGATQAPSLQKQAGELEQ